MYAACTWRHAWLCRWRVRPAVTMTHTREYAPNVAWRERGGAEDDPFGILPPLLDLLGDLSDQNVLDAGCGEGYLARVLAVSGARITGMDISPRLVEQARKEDPGSAIDYRVADLTQPLPDQAGSFDAVAGYLVLNDVPDCRGFARAIAMRAVRTTSGAAVLQIVYSCWAAPQIVKPGGGRVPYERTG